MHGTWGGYLPENNKSLNMATTTRFVTRTKRIKQTKCFVGTFKSSTSYEIDGTRKKYDPELYTYTSYKSGETVRVFYKELPKLIELGNWRESVLHLVPSTDLTWKIEWIDSDTL